MTVKVRANCTRACEQQDTCSSSDDVRPIHLAIKAVAEATRQFFPRSLTGGVDTINILCLVADESGELFKLSLPAAHRLSVRQLAVRIPQHGLRQVARDSTFSSAFPVCILDATAVGFPQLSIVQSTQQQMPIVIAVSISDTSQETILELSFSFDLTILDIGTSCRIARRAQSTLEKLNQVK